MVPLSSKLPRKIVPSKTNWMAVKIIQGYNTRISQEFGSEK